MVVVCPKCATEMSEGAVLMRGTFWGFFWYGLSYLKLFFRPEGSEWKDDLEILNPDQRKVAHRCPKCLGIFIDERPWVAPRPAKSGSPRRK